MNEDKILKEFFRKNDEELQKNIQLPKGIVDVSGTSEALYKVIKKIKSPFEDHYENGDPKQVIYVYDWESDCWNRKQLKDVHKSDIFLRIKEADHTYTITMATEEPIQNEEGKWTIIGLNYKQSKGFTEG